MVWPLPETALGVLRNCLVGALTYTRCTPRDTIILLVRILLVRSQGFPPRTNDLTPPPAMATAENKSQLRVENKTVSRGGDIGVINDS